MSRALIDPKDNRYWLVGTSAATLYFGPLSLPTSLHFKGNAAKFSDMALHQLERDAKVPVRGALAAYLQ